MSRQSHFSAKHYESDATGPFSFLNPTVRRKALPAIEPIDSQKSGSQDTLQGEGGAGEKSTQSQRPRQKKDDEISASDVHHKWTSRDNRKGRHALAVTPAVDQNPRYKTPPPTRTLRAAVQGIIRMFTTYPYWDVSYLVAIVFTLGSLCWCINAFFVWLPLVAPSTEFHGEIASGGGITAFIGATIFEFGSILLMIEAVNENRSDCFGWNVERLLEENGLLHLTADLDGCQHHHQNKKNFIGKGQATTGNPVNTAMQSKDHPMSDSKRSWTWWPTWYELRTHYIREIGFLACAAQMFGATIFWISGFTALPGVNNKLSTPALNGAYWTPQVVGGTGFIVSGLLFMLETQQKWYLPAPKVLGWHIGLWNLIGALGFTLCGALGYASENSGAVYESSLATFWGSWAFLIGSSIQWFESLDKHPVDVEEGGGRVADTKPVA